eukprot:g35269.t1
MGLSDFVFWCMLLTVSSLLLWPNHAKLHLEFDLLCRSRLLLLWLVIFRATNSLVLKTYFNPDEYWQALEVAHQLVFGYIPQQN